MVMIDELHNDAMYAARQNEVSIRLDQANDNFVDNCFALTEK
jgi:hypothetical protein